jgi:hypothetical protein
VDEIDIIDSLELMAEWDSAILNVSINDFNIEVSLVDDTWTGSSLVKLTASDELGEGEILEIVYTVKNSVPEYVYTRPEITQRGTAVSWSLSDTQGVFSLGMVDDNGDTLYYDEVISDGFLIYPLRSGSYGARIVVRDSLGGEVKDSWNYAIDIDDETEKNLLAETWAMTGFGMLDSVPHIAEGDLFSLLSWETDALWDPLFQRYQQQSVSNRLVPGKGYWLLTQDSISLAYRNYLTRDSVITYTLLSDNEGWNMVSNPFSYPVHLDSVFSERGLVCQKWDSENVIYKETQVLLPLEACWIQVSEDVEIHKVVRPWMASLGADANTAANADDGSNMGLPALLAKNQFLAKEGSVNLISELVVDFPGYRDGGNFFGLHSDASGGLDKMDLGEAPAYPEASGSAWFVNENIYGALRKDIRYKSSAGYDALTEDDYTWKVQTIVESRGVSQVQVSVSGVEEWQASGYDLWLVQGDKSKKIPSNGSVSVAVQNGSNEWNIQALPVGMAPEASRLQMQAKMNGEYLELSYRLPGSEDRAVLLITDVDGKEYLRYSLADQEGLMQYNTQNLPEGVYYVRLYSNRGSGDEVSTSFLQIR